MSDTLVPTPAVPIPTWTSPPPGATPLQVPTVAGSLLAVAGLAAFGLCAALGASALGGVVTAALVPMVSIVGAMVLTGPALVAAHLFLRPGVATTVPVAALGQGLAAAGSVAAGIAPLALFVVATTGLWPVVLALGFALVGVACAAVTVNALARATSERPWFVLAWALLAALVSLRLAIAVGVRSLEVV
ncbi:MAG: hypothetical protein AAF721_03190 [Myxococcota bacterium]